MLQEDNQELNEIDSVKDLSDKSSSINCRICYERIDTPSPTAPCLCKGSSGHVHVSCLEKWLAESNTNSCDLCQFVFDTERIPKYKAIESIKKYFLNQPIDMGFQIRDVRNDLAIFLAFTPVALFILYVSLLGADYYSQEKFIQIPAALWSSSSILIVVSLLFFSYNMWLYAIVRYHRKFWFYWWQRESIVHIKVHNNQVEPKFV